MMTICLALKGRPEQATDDSTPKPSKIDRQSPAASTLIRSLVYNPGPA